ncbi:hypothetical protein QOZ80_4BG0338860 [Eleusine coracana subsp. coracana]|nr:hypothetical protein QOZ80_4BG0338860 [Eleusine coracana subsp. coracana]
MEKTLRAFVNAYPEFTIIHAVLTLLGTIVIMGIPLTFHLRSVLYSPEPLFLVRLVEVGGLDPCAEAPSAPLFRLAVEVDGVWEQRRGPCAGGVDEMLRVSYHGVILAWGNLPRFCVDGRSGPSASVASVVATSQGSVLRAEMRSMIHAETQALGKAEFDVEGELPGLGRLRCKTYLFQGEQMDTLPPCTVQKRPKQE